MLINLSSVNSAIQAEPLFTTLTHLLFFGWVQRQDLNLRCPGSEPGALGLLATPHQEVEARVGLDPTYAGFAIQCLALGHRAVELVGMEGFEPSASRL